MRFSVLTTGELNGIHHYLCRTTQNIINSHLMKKTLLIILSSFIISGLIIIFFLWFSDSAFRKEEIYIAAAVPLSGNHRSEGRAMLNGIKLYLDKVNHTGGINGRKIKLLIFNDKNQISAAIDAASDITENDKILLVLGHFSSPTCLAVGRIYKKSGIPAITASATAEDVTLANGLYFRIISGNRFQGNFIATYISKSLYKKSACIIFSKDRYGTELAEYFEKKACDLGIRIKGKWGFDAKNGHLNKGLNKIINSLRAIKNPGIIFVAAQGDEGARIVTTLKHAGANYAIIGSDAFATDAFTQRILKYPQEQAVPGHFSDGIYTVSPFLADIANKEAQVFRQEFLDKYNEEPSWVAACYYDAAHVAVEAVRQSKNRENENIRKYRRQIREHLENMSDPEYNSVKGITGNIFFDKNRNAKNSLSVGIYKKNKLLPAFSQYRQLLSDDSSDHNIPKGPGDESAMIVIDEKVMVKTQIVYTGIDINEISKLDMKRFRCTIDFYLWFRFQKDFDDSNIVFVNAVNPIKLGKPVMEEIIRNVTIRTYRVKADFKSNFNFYTYPFECQVIPVRFRHISRVGSTLCYVADVPGLPYLYKKNVRKKEINALTGWNISEIWVYQNMITPSVDDSDAYDPQNPISYSQFNAAIRIKKQGMDAALKICFPFFIITVILFLVYFVPSDRIEIKISMLMGVLTTTAIYHSEIRSDIPAEHILAIEYAFFTIYGAAAIFTIISLMTYKQQKQRTAL
ncbi:ABC transporter substrate-binding protein [Desulfonema magnum]|uniref:Leucine binding domain-containing protein n=1 Tax=Desulfonema magnum TaxID=45655 RepID=A0A975GKD2_9BACT|nr:ABC transporter substrate-binding protein [Desulfonema magnum]QTA84390.1 Leucine binding domain-containing protein [Desulfonema magnum]